MTVSPLQLAAWSSGAGFSGVDQVTSVAVALAVGGGAPPGKGVPEAAQGAWGIGGGGSGADQAAAAFARFKQGGWSGFPTFRNGAYLFWIPVATPVAAADALPGAHQVEAAGQAAGNALSNPVKTLAEPFLVPLHFLEDPGTWLRFAKIAVGLGLIVVGGFKFGLENIFGAPKRLIDGALNEGGNQVAEGAALVGLFSRGAARPAAAAAARPSSARPSSPRPAAKPATRKRTPPAPESERVRAARQMLREADAAKRRQREKDDSDKRGES